MQADAFQCINNQELEIIGDKDTFNRKHLKISLKIKPEYCINSETESLECALSVENEKYLESLFFVTLTNQRRFLTENYESETPLVEESVMEFQEIPIRSMLRIMEISETLLEREDNLLIAINYVTD